MKHFGDITKISGYDVPIVDVITGGSPCQDLSVAGLRKGLAGERSGLFMEQIRIIKEMREKEKQNGKTVDDIRPRYMVWENVPGAFSSNNGEDFRAVLEETAKVTDENAVIPGLANGQKWSPSGCILADGWSIAWRLHDARFWGVPQRRKRISLVADFNGQTAPEILFERKSMSRDIAQGGAKEQGSAGTITDSIGDTIAIGLNRERCGAVSMVEKMPTLQAAAGESGNNKPMVCICDKECYGISPYDSNAMKSPNPNSGIYKADSTKTLDVHGGNPNCNQGGICVVENPVAYGVDCYNQAQKKEETMAIRNCKVDNDHIPCVYCVDQGGGKSSRSVSNNVSPTLATTHGGEPVVMKSNGIESALSFQERGGKPGGGKGILIQDEHIGAMKTNQNQYVCGFPKGYVEIEKEVKTRKYAVDKDALKECLRTHKILSNKEIAEKLNQPETLVEHWFRKDDGFAIPLPEIWMELKALLGIETTEFDESIMTFETKICNFDTKNRIYVGETHPTLLSNENYTMLLNEKTSPVEVECFSDVAACRSADDGPKGVHSQMLSNPEGNFVVEKHIYSMDRAAYNQGINAKYDFAVKEDETMTLVARGPSAICECASDYKGINNQYVADDKCIVEPYQKMVGTLCASDYKEEQPILLESNQNHATIQTEGVCTTLPASMGIGGGFVPMVTKKSDPRPIVRRLTPLECERLQGFPDGWTDIGDWIDTKGKLHKGDSDTPRYKALGNSIALPFWGWMAKRMCAYLKEPTMASLFDGIGGFPLVYSQAGCKPIWASEIEEFPIAVTKRRFGED